MPSPGIAVPQAVLAACLPGRSPPGEREEAMLA